MAINSGAWANIIISDMFSDITYCIQYVILYQLPTVQQAVVSTSPYI